LPQAVVIQWILKIFSSWETDIMNQRLKGPLFILIFLLAGVFLHAQRDPLDFGDGTNFRDGTTFRDGTDFRDGTNFRDGANFPILNGEIKGEEEETPPAQEEPEKIKFTRFKNRMVELSIANVGIGFSNNFIAASDIVRNPFYLLWNIKDVIKDPELIWEEPIVIDLDRFFEGFKFGFGSPIKPVSLNFNWKDKWGFGLDIAHVDFSGNVSLSGNMVTISEAKKDQFGVGAAAFVDVGIPVFFHHRDLKIKIRPAAYVPVIYTEPKITYSFTSFEKEKDGERIPGTRFEVKYDMQVYSLVSLKGIEKGMDPIVKSLADNAWDIPKNNMGYDFGLSVEYPWLYNLDLGLDVVNIPVPFATAKLNHYMRLNGSVWADTHDLDIMDFINEDEEGKTKELKDFKGTLYDYPDNFSPEYKVNKSGKKIFRPFAMLFYAHYRPLESQSVIFIPSLGFSINRLYPKIAAVEGGLTVRLDAANLIITTLGINYNDRVWRNSIDFILNLRAFEFDLGIAFSSQSFVRSWQGAGLGVNIGLKFGW